MNRIYITFFLIFVIALSVSAKETIKIGELSCEYFKNPVGIGTPRPRLSWKLVSEINGQKQTAFQVLVASSPKLLSEKKADLWNSEKVNSDQSIQLEYAGIELKSKDQAYWKVRVWDKSGIVSDWSETATFEIGLLSSGDWKADWIKTAIKFKEYYYPALYFRKEFEVKNKIEQARIYASAFGMYEMKMNGERVGEAFLTPGWTSYDKRVQYQVYDVTKMLQAGSNAIGVTLGNGWYRAFRYRHKNEEEQKRQDLGLIVQLEILFTDGSKEVVVTDKSWKSATSPILMSEIYNGETYDARLEQPGWDKSRFNEKGWKGVEIWDKNKNLFVASVAPPVQKMEEVKPVKVIYTPEGDTVLDMGQNMVGWMRFKIDAPAGTTVKLRHSEVLDKNGNFYTESLRSAKQTVNYTCKGYGSEVFEPHFTFQGFRFVDVNGFPGKINLDDFTGIVLHSAMEPAGTFSCNDSMINQLQHNILWGQKGNFVDVPTDCPQRDERLGWTGDTQVFGSTACFNMNTAGFYTKWLHDLAADQLKNGAVPHVIPDKLGNGKRGGGSFGWADASTIVPWTVYLWYGDKRILEQQYPSMKKWVEYMRKKAGKKYIWNPGRQFGDWLAFATTRSNYPGATTDMDLLATDYFYHSANLLAKTAKILNKSEDADFYNELTQKIKKAYQKEFITNNGRLTSNTQTAYVVGLSFGLIPEEMERAAAQRLANDVNTFGHITTGFLGTPDICHVLTKYGFLDEAYKLLYRREYPSWLYPISKGATTIWERWDGIKPDGSFQSSNMNSFNHYAYGAIGSWLYQKVAGIEPNPKNPGFKSFQIKPYPGGKMNDVKATHESPYGTIISEWKIENGKFKIKVSVPVNTSAEIYVPATNGKLLVNGEWIANSEKHEVPGLNFYFKKIEVGSGSYEFESSFFSTP